MEKFEVIGRNEKIEIVGEIIERKHVSSSEALNMKTMCNDLTTELYVLREIEEIILKTENDEKIKLKHITDKSLKTGKILSEKYKME